MPLTQIASLMQHFVNHGNERTLVFAIVVVMMVVSSVSLLIMYQLSVSDVLLEDKIDSIAEPMKADIVSPARKQRSVVNRENSPLCASEYVEIRSGQTVTVEAHIGSPTRHGLVTLCTAHGTNCANYEHRHDAKVKAQRQVLWGKALKKTVPLQVTNTQEYSLFIEEGDVLGHASSPGAKGSPRKKGKLHEMCKRCIDPSHITNTCSECGQEQCLQCVKDHMDCQPCCYCKSLRSLKN